MMDDLFSSENSTEVIFHNHPMLGVISQGRRIRMIRHPQKAITSPHDGGPLVGEAGAPIATEQARGFCVLRDESCSADFTDPEACGQPRTARDLFGVFSATTETRNGGKAAKLLPANRTRRGDFCRRWPMAADIFIATGRAARLIAALADKWLPADRAFPSARLRMLSERGVSTFLAAGLITQIVLKRPSADWAYSFNHADNLA